MAANGVCVARGVVSAAVAAAAAASGECAGGATSSVWVAHGRADGHASTKRLLVGGEHCTEKAAVFGGTSPRSSSVVAVAALAVRGGAGAET